MAALTDLTDSRSMVVDSSGLAQVQLGPPGAANQWKIKRAIINVTPAGTTVPSEFFLYVTARPTGPTTSAGTPAAPDASDQRDHSYSGDADVADEVSPIPVGPAEVVVGRWSGASPGAVALLSIVYDLVRGSGG